MESVTERTTWKANDAGAALRELARCRANQLRLALCGEIEASAVLAERARAIRQALERGEDTPPGATGLWAQAQHRSG